MKLAKMTAEDIQAASDAYDRIAAAIFAEVKHQTPPHVLTRILIYHAANSAAAMELSREAFAAELTTAFDRAVAALPPEMS